MVLGYLCLFVFVILFIAGVSALFSYGTTGVVMLFIAFLFGIYGYRRIKSHKKEKKVLGGKTQRKRYCAEGYCLAGLPFGEAPCTIDVYNNTIVFSSGKNTTSLSFAKLISASVKTRDELVGASTGKAILGAALFGTVGAIIASRPKSKTEYILVINYFSDENKSIAISFDATQRFNAENIAYFLMKKAPEMEHTVL